MGGLPPERTMRMMICWQNALRSWIEECNWKIPALIIFKLTKPQNPTTKHKTKNVKLKTAQKSNLTDLMVNLS